MNTLNLKIVAPNKTLFDGEVVFVKLPGSNGDFSLLSHHAPFISSLSDGSIIYRLEQGNEVTINIIAGFVEVSNNHVTVCVQSSAS